VQTYHTFFARQITQKTADGMAFITFRAVKSAASKHSAPVPR
jgi:hypothetical protein